MMSESSSTMEINNFIIDFFDLFNSNKNQNISKICDLQLLTFVQTNPGLELADIVNTDKENILHIAISSGKTHLTQGLIYFFRDYYREKGKMEVFTAWLTQRNYDNLTPLDHAILMNDGANHEMITLIADTYLDSGIDLIEEYYREGNSKLDNAIHNCAKLKDPFPLIYVYEKLINKQMKKSSVNFFNFPNESNGKIPLHYACFFGNHRVVEILLDLGSYINSKDKNNDSPLMAGIHTLNKSNVSCIVSTLVKRGACTKIRNKRNKSAMDLALQIEMTSLIFVMEENKKKVFHPLSKHILFQILLSCTILLKAMLLILIYCTECFALQGNQNIRETQKFTYNTRTNDMSQMVIINIDDYFYCLMDKNCSFEGVLLFLSLFCDLFVTLAIVFVKLYYKIKSSSENEKKSRGSSLCGGDLVNVIHKIEIFCVKCKRERGKDTVHCLICNKCIDNFENHFDMLNLCVTKNNKKYMRVIYYALTVMFIANFSFFTYSAFFISFGRADKFFNKHDSMSNLIFKILIYLFVIIYAFIFLRILLKLCRGKQRRRRAFSINSNEGDFEDNELRFSNRNKNQGLIDHDRNELHLRGKEWDESRITYNFL